MWIKGLTRSINTLNLEALHHLMPAVQCQLNTLAHSLFIAFLGLKRPLKIVHDIK